MARIAPPTLLLTPPPPPPRPYGLFNVALGPMPFPVEAAVAGGVEYVPDTCEDDVYLYDMTCPAVSGSKTYAGVESAISGAPFSVVVSYTCNVVGYDLSEVENRIRTRMTLHEQKAVERRLWQGQFNAGLGVIPGLFTQATPLAATSCITDAMALLEQTLADNSIVGGIIHARPYMASHMATAHLIERGPGGQITTKRGIPVCFGEGYDGTGPAGQAVTATAEYMYATGRVVIWGTPDTFIPPLGEVLDRSTNILSAVGEKIYAVAVECGIWSTAVTRTCTTAGES